MRSCSSSTASMKVKNVKKWVCTHPCMQTHLHTHTCVVTITQSKGIFPLFLSIWPNWFFSRLSFTKGHFPKLAECAHFHYENVDFGTLQVKFHSQQNQFGLIRVQFNFQFVTHWYSMGWNGKFQRGATGQMNGSAIGELVTSPTMCLTFHCRGSQSWGTMSLKT